MALHLLEATLTQGPSCSGDDIAELEVHVRNEIERYVQLEIERELYELAQYTTNDTLLTRIHELENENGQIRRLLLDRENDNISLQTELERIRTHAIGFDTMKTSLEHNRAHLQRELYAKEGEINRLQCVLRV